MSENSAACSTAKVTPSPPTGPRLLETISPPSEHCDGSLGLPVLRKMPSSSTRIQGTASSHPGSSGTTVSHTRFHGANTVSESGADSSNAISFGIAARFNTSGALFVTTGFRRMLLNSSVSGTALVTSTRSSDTKAPHHV